VPFVEMNTAIIHGGGFSRERGSIAF